VTISKSPKPKLAKPKAKPKSVTLTPESLQRLGTARLAQLVFELSATDAVIKRRLKIELARPEGAIQAIAKRFATIAKSKSFIDWRKLRVMQEELLDQRAAIIDIVAPADPGAALDLLWQFMGLASPVIDRSFDMNGTLVYLFRDTVPLLANVATTAKPLPDVLAQHVKTALLDNSYGQYDGLIEHVGPALGETGLSTLKGLIMTAMDDQVPASELKSHVRTCEAALRHIADAQSDVDAFIASYSAKEVKSCGISAQIGERLLKAGRANEALVYLDASMDDVGKGWAPWEAARADALEALGRTDDAQAFRLACFERSLNADLLRVYIKRLPDFDDEEALDKALDYARDYPDLAKAVAFLIEWPSLKHASARICKDAEKLDGNAYVWLTELGKTFDENHPLAATLVRRSMVEFALTHAKTKRYKYVARHIRECQASAAHIDDWHNYPDHDAWVTPLMRDHARKFGVWNHV
jgi:hypothetical protein